MAGGYRFLEHMTDAVIEAYGESVAEAFENAAVALNDTMVDVSSVSPSKEISLVVRGSDLPELLFEWLDKVMLLLLVDHFVMCAFKVKIKKDACGFSIDASARGETLDLNKHPFKVEIKAVTYHEMQVIEKDGQAIVRFILDL